jgi:hypothetical protein
LKKIFHLLCITAILFTIHPYAKGSSLEDKNTEDSRTEDRSTDWSILHNGLGSIIEVYDTEKKSKVIEFSSNSNRDTYINGAKKGIRAWNNRTSKTIQWSFKYSQNYVAIITLATVKGYRNLVYTANDKDFKSYIGLGSHTIQGEWVTITRNLEEDLHRQDPTNKIVAVNGFAIRGDGRVTDVHMLKVIKRSIVRSLYQTIEEALLYLRNKRFISDSITPKTVKNEPTAPKTKNTAVPTITLINGDKIYINVNEPFIDPGVIANDSNGLPLDVELIGDINTSIVDSHPLHYLAIDDNGNASSTTRLVVVLSKNIEDLKVKKEISAPKDNNSTEQIDENEKQEIREAKIEKKELEELYRKEMGKEMGIKNNHKKVATQKSETEEEIDNIFQNAKGDTHEEKLQNIAIRLEELMDEDK